MKFCAAFMVGYGVMDSLFITASGIMGLSEAVERIQGRWQSLILIGLGLILWQLCTLAANSKHSSNSK